MVAVCYITLLNVYSIINKLKFKKSFKYNYIISLLLFLSPIPLMSPAYLLVLIFLALLPSMLMSAPAYLISAAAILHGH